MNVLFVSLTRFGDLLQTQASITDVAKAGHTVGVVCLQNFLPTVHLMEHVAHVFPFVGNVLLANLAPALPPTISQESGEKGSATGGDGILSFESNSDGWLKATKELKEWRDMVWREFAPDVVINLSPAKSSRLLASFIGSEAFIGGFALDGQSTFYNRSLWASVMQGAVGQRGIIPYNLVDIFRGITADSLENATSPGEACETAFTPFDGTISQTRLQAPSSSICRNAYNDLERGFLALGFAAYAEKEMNNRALIAHLPQDVRKNKVTGFVGMQLGASATERQWPLAYFARVGDFLWERYGLLPVLFGTASEGPLAKEYEGLVSSPHLSMVGKTGLVDLGAHLLNCLFLLTNDTGTMHLAAGLGVPSFAIFLATAQPFDTGPYLPGCYCFEPDLPCHPCNFNTPCPYAFMCRHFIKPETIIACMQQFMDNTEGPTVPDTVPDTVPVTVPATVSGTVPATIPVTLLDHIPTQAQPVESSDRQACLTGARVWISVVDEKGGLSLAPVTIAEKHAPYTQAGTHSYSQVTPATSLVYNPADAGTEAHSDNDKNSSQSENSPAPTNGTLYAKSRGPLVKLQRALLWAFTESYKNMKANGGTYEMGEVDFSAVDVLWCADDARVSLVQDAHALFQRLEILERQGEVLLLRPVELMQQRFLESWQGVYHDLNESHWFCFLTSLWVDLTQAPDAEFREIMGTIKLFKELFERCSATFAKNP